MTVTNTTPLTVESLDEVGSEAGPFSCRFGPWECPNDADWRVDDHRGDANRHYHACSDCLPDAFHIWQSYGVVYQTRDGRSRLTNGNPHRWTETHRKFGDGIASISYTLNHDENLRVSRQNRNPTTGESAFSRSRYGLRPGLRDICTGCNATTGTASDSTDFSKILSNRTLAKSPTSPQLPSPKSCSWLNASEPSRVFSILWENT